MTFVIMNDAGQFWTKAGSDEYWMVDEALAAKFETSVEALETLRWCRDCGNSGGDVFVVPGADD